MIRVIVESPWRAVDSITRRRYNTYSRRAIIDSINRSEAPIAFHRFYTQFLDDNKETERKLGIQLSEQWYPGADLIAVYADYGISFGMTLGIQLAARLGKPIVMRYLLRGKGR